MKVSRREFVSTATCAAAASLCALPVSGSPAKADRRCTLLNLKSNCALPESFAGMQAALGDSHRHVAENQLESAEFLSSMLGTADAGRVLIVAAAGSVQPETFRGVADFLKGGSTVLWESGAAFLNPSEFAAQQELALDYFGISMDRPRDVWSPSIARKSNVRTASPSARGRRAIGHEQIPYVAYRWPREVHVRDFSRVIPVSAASGGVIAHWGKVPVAWRKSVGAGTLVFVGSPIGPALLAGDSEAHSLLHSIITA